MAIIMRGALRPNPPLVQHYHGDIHITTPREFVVDDSAAAVVDEPGKALVLPLRIYDEIKFKFGQQLICEPVGGLDSEASARRIAELEAKVAELETQIAARKK